jgi:hypothetical protein
MALNVLSVFPSGDGMGKGMVEGHEVIKAVGPVRMGRLPAGMESGASSVAILATLPTGHVVMVETSWANFEIAFAAMNAREKMDNSENRAGG